MLLEDADALALATEVIDQGHSRLPMELETSANFIRDTVDYLMTGTENIILGQHVDQVCSASLPSLKFECELL